MQLFLSLEWVHILLGVVVLRASATEELKKTSNVKGALIDHPECSSLRSLCNGKDKEDLVVLECVNTLHPQQVQSISDDCQHIVWERTDTLIQDENIKDFLLPLCRKDMDLLDCGSSKGNYFKCLANSKDNIEDADCKEMVLRLESVAFTDYLFIASFLEQCKSDVQTLKCGKIDSHGPSQFNTVSCLQNNILKVSDNCKKEVFKLSELQSDNIKLDHQMYLDCAEDHSRYCSQFAPGSGKIFNCLMRQESQRLSAKCKQSLNRRKKLISQDYRVSKGLMRACRDDIKKTHCRRQTSSDKNIRLAQILLCLESISRNGSRVSSDCEAELFEHRKMLMEDYRLSPEIVDSCKNEISYFCNRLEAGGKTIHCLMGRQANKDTHFSDKCVQALGDLVKEANVAENWRVDPVLYEACSSAVAIFCNDVKSGDARVMNCLMDHIGSEQMPEDCENAVMQIQYFVARKFELDPYLYGACKVDAATLCMEPKEWDHEQNPHVLPCLYRYLQPDEDDRLKQSDHPTNSLSLSPGCARNIHRVMRQRALSAHLEPSIEENCLSDLALYCHDKVNPGEEMMCLQRNYEDLVDGCKQTIGMFTGFQAEHADLNPYITRYCGKIIKTLCSVESKNDEGDVMECLISHKNDVLVKQEPSCRGSIEHFQLISLNDYRFSFKFKEACKPYAMRYCAGSKTKNDVVRCLSEQVLNATIHGVKGQVSRECKQQLKSQLFQQRENIKFDVKLNKACQHDIEKFCSRVPNEKAEVLECLQSVSNGKLTNECEKEVFKVKKQEVFDNSVDFALKTTCENEIEQFCSKYKIEHVLDCLKKNKNEKGFDKKCRTVVTHRIIEQNSNYQLNPSLQENCHMDINKFCKNALQAHIYDDVDGVVIKCLKEQFRRSRLSSKCEKEMTSILREQAMDINLNPLIRAVCSNELKTICKVNDEEDSGDAEECLKDALLGNRIQTPECKEEVANMIEESQADIHVDPILHRACSIDLLSYCNDVPQGNGRLIQCLTKTLNSNVKLSPTCKNMLKKRIELYRNAAQIAPNNAPQDLTQLYGQVVESPSRQYFLVILLAVTGTIFLTGIMCGRLNKRKYMLLKTK